MKKFLTLFVLAVTLVSNAQESVLLRLNYEKGTKYTMKMDMSQGQMTMAMKANVNVVAAEGDTYTTETKFLKVTVDVFAGGTMMSFDSDTSDDDLDEFGQQVKSQMGPMLEAVVTSTSNSLGKVIEIKAEPDFQGASDMGKQSNIVFPKKAVKVGSTWNMEKDQNGSKVNFTYTVKSILKDKVILELSGKSAEADISGSMDIDRKSGIPLKSVVNMNISAGGQEMKSTITTQMIKM